MNVSAIGRAMTHSKPLIALEIAGGIGAISLLSGCSSTPKPTATESYARTYQGVKDATHGDLSTQGMAKVTGQIVSHNYTKNQTYELGDKAGRLYERYFHTLNDEPAALHQTLYTMDHQYQRNWL